MPTELTRRGLIRGLGLLLAAPAIVRVSSLMPIRPERALLLPSSRVTLLTMSEITREAVRLFRNSNMFLQEMDEQYPNLHKSVSPSLRSRLPNNFSVEPTR